MISDSTNAPMSDSTRLVPIRTACAMYGVNPNTLRGWERRYGLLSPARGEGGQRGFGPADLDVIRQMAELTRGGMTASEAAEQILAQRKRLTKTAAPQTRWIERFTRAVTQLDVAAIADICISAGEEFGYSAGVETVIFPALNKVGEMWHESNLTVAEEHCATLAVRGFLSMEHVKFLKQHKADARRPSIVLACVPGEQHDLPVLHLANLIAHSGRAKAVPLAAGLPLKDILITADRVAAAVILLSGTMPATSAEVREWVGEVAAAGWQSRCVLAGGTFTNSRIFSETDVRAAAGSYSQAVELLLRMAETTAT
jgi:DNA-binding transcriptional MerR regulator